MLGCQAPLQHHQENEGEDHCEGEDQAELVGFLHVSQSALKEACIGYQDEIACIEDEEDNCHSLDE